MEGPLAPTGILLDRFLLKAARHQGHRCPGQVLGARMALLGCGEVGIGEPLGADRGKLYVFVEMDCCATDAISVVTGCTLGKRTLRHVDYGILAATFVNLETDCAVRVVVEGEAWGPAARVCPAIGNQLARERRVSPHLPDSNLFRVERVDVTLPPEDLPDFIRGRVQCVQCGEWVQESREVCQEGLLLCRGCAWGRYYRRRGGGR